MMRSGITRRSLAGLSLLLAAACNAGNGGVAKVHADDRLPSESLSDWVSYSDEVVLATVASEVEVRQPGDVNAAGEGITSRSLTFSLNRSLWSRTGAPRVQATFQMVHDGWIFRKGSNRGDYQTGDVRFMVGNSYLLALTSYPEGWGTVGSAAFGTTDRSGRVTPGNWSNAALSRLVGKSPEEVAGLLRVTPPDPIAARHFDLPAVQRFAAVVKERQG